MAATTLIFVEFYVINEKWFMLVKLKETYI